MNLQNLYLFKKRHYREVIIIAVICALFSGIFYQVYKAGNAVDTTVFVNIGYKVNENNSKEASSAYELVQAADAFSETVQGWFKNPAFLEKIKIHSSLDISPAAKKQEKQNLLITYKSRDEQEAKKLAQVIRADLQEEIGNYNRATNSLFQLAVYEPYYKDESSKMMILIILVGFILGACLAFLLCYLYEKISNSTIYVSDIELICGKALDIFPANRFRKDKLNFFGQYLDQQGEKNPLIISVGYDAVAFKKALGKFLPGHKPEFTNFPLSFEYDKVKHHKLVFLLVKLGTSNLYDLEKVQNFLPAGSKLLIQA